MSTNPPERRPGPLLWIVPLLSFSIMFIGLALPYWWHAMDLNPVPIGYLRLTGVILTIVILIFLVIWFFGFTWVSRPTKWKVFAILAILLAALTASVDEVIYDANIVPSFRFRWQPSPEQKLAEYLDREKPDPSGLPKIDLTIHKVHDFPRYRGLGGDGIVRPSDLLDLTWEQAQPKTLWRHQCGGGFSGLVVAGNVAITLEQRKADEVIVCYDRLTGVERWAYAYPAWFQDRTGKGPRATPTISEDGEVYSLGAMGDLVCLDGASGTCKWRTNIISDNDSKVVTWGMTSSPLVVDDLVIVNAGVDPENNVGRALVAYDRKDGKRVWGAGTHKASYSSPVLATLQGRRQVLLFDAGGLAGHDLKSGQELWRYPWQTFQDMNIVQPLVIEGDRVLISSEVTNGCAMLHVTRKGKEFGAEVVWENRNLAARQANPVRVRNSIYGLHNGSLVCLDLETGKRRWRGKDYGQGQLLAMTGALIIQSERGDLALVADDPKQFRELARMSVFPDRRTWNTPALAGRHLFLRNDAEMVCFELPLRE